MTYRTLGLVWSALAPVLLAGCAPMWDLAGDWRHETATEVQFRRDRYECSVGAEHAKSPAFFDCMTKRGYQRIGEVAPPSSSPASPSPAR